MKSDTQNNFVPSIQIKSASGWEFPNLAEIWKLRELLYIMIRSSLKGKYRQSLLSSVYLFIQPLFSVGIFTFIFSKLAKIETGEIPYPLFSMIGVTTWNFFNRALNDGNSSLVTMGSVLSKVYMPRLIVVLVSVFIQLFEFIIAFAFSAVFFAYYQILPSSKIIFLPFAILAVVVFSISIILWLSNINVRFRDVSMLLPGAVQILFYATPVVYPLGLVPEKWKWLFLLNPMTNILEFIRYCLFDNYPFPELKFVFINLIMVGVLLIFGLFVFHRFSKTLVDRI